MLQLLQLAAGSSLSLQISAFAFLLPYIKYAAEAVYLIAQVSLLIIQFSGVWLAEIAYQCSTFDVLLLILSVGVTTKMLMDAADLGFAAINIPAYDTQEEYPNSLPYFQSQFPYKTNDVPQSYEPLLSDLSEKIREKEALNRVRAQILNGNANRNTDSMKNYFENSSPDASRSAQSSILEHASYLSLINDKDNFQTSGCGWDLIRMNCHDLFGLCKGGCRDFAIAINSPFHDCRCVPVGYTALLKIAGR